MLESSHNHVERVLGAHNVRRMSTADAAQDGGQRLGDGHGDDGLLQGLLLESTDALELAAGLVADRKARATLTRHAAELIAFSQARPAVAREGRAPD